MSNAQMPFINPATGEQFGAVDVATPEMVQQARAAMGARSQTWAATTVKQRAALLEKLRKVILDNLDPLTEVISRDTGKSRQDALIEVFMTVDKMHQYGRRAAGWLKPQRVPSGLYIFKRYYAEPQPYGTVAVISPWNYPFDLAMPPVVAALLAGNTVLLKPSEVTPAVGVMMEKLIRSVPELALNVRVLHGGADVGAALVDSRPDLVFFTGSVRTARIIGQEAAKHLIPFLHELGGKDPMLVLDDADVDAAAEWGCWGAYYNAGQSCVAVERVYAHESIYQQFLEKVLVRTAAIATGYSAEIESIYNYGPMTDERQLAVVREHLEDAVKRGARVVAGGKIDGNFVEPTVLVDVDHTMMLMREETFGPVLPIMKVGDEEEAIRLANDNAYGLSASVWSRDVARARRIAEQIEAGSVIINDTIAHYGVPLLPFGGVKQSGNARTHGSSEVLQFTQMRSYAVGQPPIPFDLATLMRRPGHYWLGEVVLKGVFGVTLGQRFDAVRKVIRHFRPEKTEPDPAPPGDGTENEHKRNNRIGAAAGAAALGAGALLLALVRGRRR